MHSISRIKANALAIDGIGFLAHREEIAAINPTKVHPDLALRPIDRLDLLQPFRLQRLKRLGVHGLELKRVRFVAFWKAFANAVKA